ncbi:hypothetical protein D3C85_833420 [compost metagenome]
MAQRKAIGTMICVRDRLVSNRAGEDTGADARQIVAPERTVFSRLLMSQPLDVVAIDPAECRGWLISADQMIIEVKDFSDDSGHAPAIQQNVMVRPDQLVHMRAMGQQREACQRRRFKIESVGAVVFHHALEQHRIITARHDRPGALFLLRNILHRPSHRVPVESAAQDRVTFSHQTPCVLQHTDVDLAIDVQDILQDVSIVIAHQVLKQDPLLCRGQGVDIRGYGSRLVDQSPQLIVGQIGVRIVGRHAHQGCAGTVSNDLVQCCAVACRNILRLP